MCQCKRFILAQATVLISYENVAKFSPITKNTKPDKKNKQLKTSGYIYTKTHGTLFFAAARFAVSPFVTGLGKVKG